MARVFISYRREDSGGHAGRLFDRLSTQFGPEQTFIDLELEPGVDYLNRIHETISTCAALLVVIGPRWATIEGPGGRQRLHDPDDLVRLEVEAALRRDGVVTIPVLVQGATMPQPERLPPSLRPLVRRNALEISDSRFDYDTTRLVAALERNVGIRPKSPSGESGPARNEARPKGGRLRLPRRRVTLVAAIVPLLAVLALLLFLLLPDSVHVPDVVGTKSLFEADRALADAGLRLAPETKEKVAAKVPPGTVLSQTPQAGETAEKGSEVTIRIAVASGRISVPKVTGLSLGEAEAALRARHLSLGKARPQPVDPQAKIKSQSPVADEIVNEGSPVDIVLR